MLVECRMVSFNKKFEAFAAPERIPEVCGFRGSSDPELCGGGGGGGGGAHGGWRAVPVPVPVPVPVEVGLRGYFVL
jgi:hypothetical protein